MNRRPLCLAAATLLLAVGGCGPAPDTDTDAGQMGVPYLELSHDHIDFGEVAVGEGAIASLTIDNVGDGDLYIRDVKLQDEDGPFDFAALGSVVLGPGTSTDLDLIYVPTTAAEDSTEVLIDTNTSEGTASIELIGWGMAPVLHLAADAADPVEATVGCTAAFDLHLTNLGNAELVVYDIELERTSSVEDEWSWAAPGVSEGGDDAMPTIGPGENAQLELRYTPLDEAEDTAILHVTSNDPVAAERSLPLRATGTYASWAHDTWEQPVTTVLDVIFALDKGGSMGQEMPTVVSNMVSFTNELAAQGLDAQVAVTVAEDGCIVGDDLWIDGSFSQAEVASTIDDMIDLGGSYSHNTERAFTMLADTLEETAAGGCNDGLVREEARLHLVGVSDEPEQSAHPWDSYVTLFQSYKADPRDVVVHGVGGDYPGGCDGASAYSGVYEAAMATGGTMVSICADDWWLGLAGLADGGIGRLDRFPLDQPAVEETVIVMVDGDAITTGWSYDNDNSVVFETARIPEGGAIVEIGYAVTPECCE